jgi:hypothetical protein
VGRKEEVVVEKKPSFVITCACSFTLKDSFIKSNPRRKELKGDSNRSKAKENGKQQ